MQQYTANSFVATQLLTNIMNTNPIAVAAMKRLQSDIMGGTMTSTPPVDPTSLEMTRMMQLLAPIIDSYAFGYVLIHRSVSRHRRVKVKGNQIQMDDVLLTVIPHVCYSVISKADWYRTNARPQDFEPIYPSNNFTVIYAPGRFRIKPKASDMLLYIWDPPCDLLSSLPGYPNSNIPAIVKAHNDVMSLQASLLRAAHINSMPVGFFSKEAKHNQLYGQTDALIASAVKDQVTTLEQHGLTDSADYLSYLHKKDQLGEFTGGSVSLPIPSMHSTDEHDTTLHPITVPSKVGWRPHAVEISQTTDAARVIDEFICAYFGVPYILISNLANRNGSQMYVEMAQANYLRTVSSRTQWLNTILHQLHEWPLKRVSKDIRSEAPSVIKCQLQVSLSIPNILYLAANLEPAALRRYLARATGLDESDFRAADAGPAATVSGFSLGHS